jgi:DNA-binding MltR family transcriptional regulator
MSEPFEVPAHILEAGAKALYEHQVKAARTEFEALGLGISDAKDFFLHLKQESDAALSVLSASYIDAHLTDAWKRNMPGKSNATYDLLFDNNGPLATFSGKIRVAHGLGWLTDELASSLHVLRKIRNRFAHDPYKQQMADNEINSLIASLPSREVHMLRAVGYSETLLKTFSPRLLYHLRSTVICFDVGSYMLAAPIASRRQVPVGAVLGGYDDGTKTMAEYIRTLARIVLELAGPPDEGPFAKTYGQLSDTSS